MRFMLDTNIIIYLIKNKPESVAAKVDQLKPNDDLVMSFVTYAELLKGAENSSQKARVLHNLEKLIEQISVVYPINAQICQHYAVQFLRLKQSGTLIGANDLWIACHALAEQAVLVTHNVREFQRIDGLVIEDWVE